MEAPARAETTTAAPRYTAFSVLCNVALAAFFSLFLYAQLTAEREWDWSYNLPVVVQQSVMVLAFLTRRPGTTSQGIGDWIVGIAGTLLPLLLQRPEGPGELAWLGRPLMILGVIGGVIGLLSLGRSVAVVAANRGIKTGGAYRLVRHPLYAAYVAYFVGFLLTSPSPRNIAVVAGTLSLFVIRALVEERLLLGDSDYRAYCETVRWRMIPGVF